MTDEEMAGQNAGNISGLDISTILMVAENKTDAYRLGRYEGFLAGLKAGRPQWHDLRENPNDLPKEYDIIQKAFGIWEERRDTHIVQNQDGERVCCLNGKWYYEEGGEAYVLAWCEIPIYDKE